MPLFNPFRSHAPEPGRPPAFDPHFGFSPGFEAPPVAGGDNGVDGPRAPRTLAGACAALCAGAMALGDPETAEVFEALPARMENHASPLSETEWKAFLQSDGAELLHMLAGLAGNESLPAPLRQTHLADVAQAFDLCLPGCAAALREAVHQLGCSTGGVARTAAGRRAELIRQTLQDVVSTTIGRDPREGARTLRNFESHYVTALELRLGLAAARGHPPDLYLDAGSLSPRVLERARTELRLRVTPAAIARSIAEEALDRLRASLMAAGVDPGRIWPATADRQATIDKEIAAIEKSLGLVGRWTLFEEDLDLGRVGLIRDPTRLAVQVLLNLMKAQAVPARPIETRMTWKREGEDCRLRQLTDGLWWVQTGRAEAFVADETESLGVRHLRKLDHPSQHRLRRDLGPAAREALARTPILMDREERLPAVAHHWLVSAELARAWWGRMGEARCKAWLQANPAFMLSEDLRFRLMRAADEADDGWAFARLLPGKEAAAARAWIACDGTGAVASAARGGDARRLSRWLGLLRVAAPMMNARQRGEALVARDDAGQSALNRVMDRLDGAACARELLGAVLAMHDRRRALTAALSPDALTVLAGGPPDDLGAIGVALASGVSDTLSTYLGVVEQAHRTGLLASQDLRVLILGWDDGDDAGPRRGFELAMARNHAEAVGVWTQALIHLARKRLLSAEELKRELAAARMDGRWAYHEAMRAGAQDAARRFRGALQDARDQGLLNREQIGELLCGAGPQPHALSAAAAAGHLQTIKEHLEDELPLLDFPFTWEVNSVERLRWHRRGGHAALGAALRHGQADAVGVLAARCIDLHRAGWRWVLFPTLAGLHRHRPALHDAVAAGHFDAVEVLTKTLAAAVRAGWMGPRTMTSLLAIKDCRGVRLLDMAALELDDAPLARLLDLVVDASRSARLGSSDLLRLLGPMTDRRSPLAAAVLADRPRAVREVGLCLLRLAGDGLLAPGELRKLLALRGWRRWPGKASRLLPPASPPRPEGGIAAYVALVEEAVLSRLVDARRAHRWLFPWIAALEAGRPPIAARGLTTDA